MQTKRIYGFGINDSKKPVSHIDKKTNKRVMCPYYARWVSMLSRCYSTEFHKRQPTYINATVSENWRKFSTFKTWMKTQDWENKELDKDIKYPGNLCYSEDTCLFIDKHVNSLLSDSKGIRGKYPQGVSYFKRDGNFKAQIKIRGVQKHIGYTATIKEAEALYLKAKILNIENTIAEGLEPETVEGLLKHKEVIKHRRDMLC